MASKRRQQINAILADLAKYQPPVYEQYAVDENIRFFQAARDPLNFLHWQLFIAPKLDATKLLELADLPLNHWQAVMYEQLNSVERKKFPGLLKPLRNHLLQLPAQVYLDIGCGNMEVERQLVLRLRESGSGPKIFIGLDLSSMAYQMIKHNLQDLAGAVEIKKLSSLDKKTLHSWRSRSGSKHLIIFIQQDALKSLQKSFPFAEVDVIYSSKFKHHLTLAHKTALDKLLLNSGRPALEFDDYRTAASWIPIAITAWSKPVLLNGALISRLRQPSKKELKQAERQNISFFSPPGSYIRVLKQSKT